MMDKVIQKLNVVSFIFIFVLVDILLFIAINIVKIVFILRML